MMMIMTLKELKYAKICRKLTRFSGQTGDGVMQNADLLIPLAEP